jgi:hypothetical protein
MTHSFVFIILRLFCMCQVLLYRITNKNRLIPYRKLELGSELFKAIKSVTIGPLCQASPEELAKFLVCKCDNCFCGIDTIYKSTLTYV